MPTESIAVTGRRTSKPPGAVTPKAAGFLLGWIALGLGLGYGLSRNAQSLPAAPNTLAAARPASQAVVGAGRLEPQSGEIDLSSDVAGILSAIPVKEGDAIKKDQLLAEMINQDALSRVAQADATLQVQVARLNKLKKGPRVEERQQAVAAIQEQDANLDRLQKDLARQKTLYQNGYLSSALLEQAQSAQAVAMAKKKISVQALAQMDAGPRSEDVASADAEVLLARAQLDEAKAALEKTRVRAPMDAVVLRVYKHPGEGVGLGSASPILQIGSLDRLVVRTQIDEADIGRVAKGAKAYVTVQAYPGKTFPGIVTDISPRLGAKTIQTGAPTEKRDASVLDVLVTLDAGTRLPIGLRVDCYVLPGTDAS